MVPKQPEHPRTLYAEFRPPPNERVRIEMFLEASEDYAGLGSAIPLPESVEAMGGAVSDHDYWTVVLHAAILRKFFQGTENVELHRVIGAIRSKIAPAEVVATAKLEALERFADATSVPSRFADTADGGSALVWERVLIELYGRHLHSDFGKWHASKRFLDRANTPPMYEWCIAAASVVASLDAFTREGAAAGTIDLVDDMRSYFNDDGTLNRDVE